MTRYRASHESQQTALSSVGAVWARMSVSRSGRFGVFLLRRVAALIPQMLGISLVTFALIRLLPGNPAELILGPQITPEGVEALARDMGLDRPLHEQYLNYISHVVQGDLGRSWFTGQTVAEDLLSRTPATLELITYSLLVSLLVGVTLGTLAAFRSRSGGGIVASALTWYTRFRGIPARFLVGTCSRLCILFPTKMGSSSSWTIRHRKSTRRKASPGSTLLTRSGAGTSRH